MIKSLKVSGLNDKIDFEAEFNSDINLFTGKNGAGKTTILKLIWFLNAGHISHLLSEINFSEIELQIDNATINVKRSDNLKKERGFTYEFIIEPGNRTFSVQERQLREIEFRHPSMFGHANVIRDISAPTIFFPTFRRIEGGFSMDTRRYGEAYQTRNNVKDSLVELSQRLSNQNQKFVASISTDDLVQLVTNEFAIKTDKFNKLQKEKSETIINKIKQRSTESDSLLLSSIQTEIETLETERNEFFKPFTTLSDLIAAIFQHKGIVLNNLTIGDISNSIASEKLSAGEKQMLSFICYNTFTKNSSIFIDEPELSLHPDWQRILLPTLLKQGNNNQFFMATHSPFIYSKFSDKEIVIELDKGDN